MEHLEFTQQWNRRHFLKAAGLGLGTAAMGMLGGTAAQAEVVATAARMAPKAKRIIYMFQSGAPSQLELFDYKPLLDQIHMTELPDSVRMGQRFTGMTASQKNFPMIRSMFKFRQFGQSGSWFSDRLPYTAQIADDICVVKSMHTEAINHDPAITFCQTGSQLAGKPSMGSWVAYGLGAMNRDLPSFMVLVSRGTGRPNDQPLYDRLWGSGFLPSQFQGVKLRSAADPVLYLSNPGGCSPTTRRSMLDQLRTLNEEHNIATGDPETLARIQQYELAFRMQTSVPELNDISNEPQHVLDLYGPSVHTPGSYARNCLLARRMAERDVRFVQLYHMGWDHHNDLPVHITRQCGDTDQASAGLVQDLKQRGMLDDTLVVWGGEFGRTVYSQGQVTADNYGRDHHPRCFSIWLTGGGIKRGITWGETDEYSYNIVKDPVHVNEMNATILACLGIDNSKLSVQHQGLDVRLTGVEDVAPVAGIMA